MKVFANIGDEFPGPEAPPLEAVGHDVLECSAGVESVQ